MTITHLELGYLEAEYLEDEYLTGQVLGQMGFQFQMEIQDDSTIGFQYEGNIIDKEDSIGFQYEGNIIDSLSPVGFQYEGSIIDNEVPIGFQYEGNIIDSLDPVGFQTEQIIVTQDPIGFQYEGTILDDSAIGFQYKGDILETLSPIGFQTEQIIVTQDPIGFQYESQVKDIQEPIGFQFEGNIIDFETAVGFQYEGFILDDLSIGFQSELTILDDLVVGFQSEMTILDDSAIGFQVERFIEDFKTPLGVELKQDTLLHHRCQGTGYLEEGYLEMPYLTGAMCVVFGWQFNQVVESQPVIGLQAEQVIIEESPIGFQFEGNIIDFETAVGFQYEGNIIDFLAPIGFQYEGNIVDFETPIGFQYAASILDDIAIGLQTDQASGTALGMQFTMVLYNITNLRILCEFDSRGTSGLNWTASNTEPGEFSVNNLNTDIVEQYWRSENLITSVNLDCDTEVPQGVFLDTLAMLNHNLTTSATVTLLGADNALFSPAGISIDIPMEEVNSYYIAPTLPLTGYRYWRLVIDDPTNPDDFLSIGTIIFGNSVIFHSECFVDRVVKGTRHFKDEVFTEGHTNVMNDRGVKNYISLDFRSIDFNGGNFSNIQEIFNSARTHLKCLYIPTPRTASRFAVFGKLVQIPEESHNFKGSDADYVDFQIEVDESL